MQKIYSLVFFMLLCVSSLFTLAATYNDNGTAKTYSLASGDVLNIVSGTFTGAIPNFASGSTINVQSGSTFKPSSFPASAAGTLNVYGSATFMQPSTNTAISNTLILNNSGTVTTGLLHIGSSQIFNYYGATLNIDSLNFAGRLENSGTINITKGFVHNSGTNLYRAGGKIYTQSYTLNAAIDSNYGYMYARGLITVTGGNAGLVNYCTIAASGGLTNDNGTLTNNGTIIVLQKSFINTSALINNAGGLIEGIDFSNGTATIAGNNITASGGGNFRFSGSTANYVKGFGAGGTTNNHLNFYDVSPTKTQIFDIQNKSADGSVTANVVAYVDTTTAMKNCPSTGSTTMYSNQRVITTLPVRLTHFFVQASSGDKALVNWAVNEEVNFHHYEVEYSTNGKDFATLAIVLPAEGTGNKTYQSKISLVAGAAKHFFRLKMIDVDQTAKYSSIALLSATASIKEVFTLKINPAQTETALAFDATAADQGVKIELVSAVGQVMYTKEVSSVKANPVVWINNLSRLNKGLYYVRVSNQNVTQVQKLLIQ